MKPAESTRTDSAKSPFAGCIIMIIAVAVMVFLVGFSILTLFRQSDAIAQFTTEHPVSIPTSSLEDREPELNALAERLESFRNRLESDEPASLSLSAEDINLAIAAYDPLRELRGTFRVEEITADSLKIPISFRLNGKPRLAREGEPGFVSSDPRFLNATMIARPVLTKGEIALRIDSLEVPGKEIPPEFIEQMSPYRITQQYLTHPELGPLMTKLTRVEIADGKLLLTRTPGEIPADAITDAQVDHASNRLFMAFGIAATIFLIFAGLIVFIGLRGKRKSL